MAMSKNQIAKREYGREFSFEDLTPGEKSSVTKKYNAQFVLEEEDLEDREDTELEEGTEDGYVTVKFGRPGVNGTKEAIVEAGTQMGEALKQTGLRINTDKEGIMKKNGSTVLYKSPVTEGTTYLIVPGVDSN